MKSIALILSVALSCVSVFAQSVNTYSYNTNTQVSVSSTTPTLLDIRRSSRNSLSFMFATNSTANLGIRYFFTRIDLPIATQTNMFKSGAIYGTYINPAGSVGGIKVPIGWSYGATAIPSSECYGIADGAGVVVNVGVGLPVKP